jgi:hypothetical protein
MTTELIRDPQSGAGPEPPDPALLQAIRPCALRMAGAEESFVKLLHEEAGSLVQHLPDQGWPFCERTARTILWLALSSDQAADTVFQTVYWLAAANRADGFPPSEYVTIGHALVRTAREMSGTHWTTTTGSAWIRFFMWLQPFLQADTRQQAAHQQDACQQDLYQQPAHQEAAREQAAGPGTTRDACDQDRRPVVEVDVFVTPGRCDGAGGQPPCPGD